MCILARRGRSNFVFYIRLIQKCSWYSLLKSVNNIGFNQRAKLSPLIRKITMSCDNFTTQNLACSAWRCQLWQWQIFSSVGSLIKGADISPSRWIWLKQGILLRKKKCFKRRHEPLVCWQTSLTFAFPSHWLKSFLISKFWSDVCEVWATSMSTGTWQIAFTVWSNHCWKIIRIKAIKKFTCFFSSSPFCMTQKYKFQQQMKKLGGKRV